MRAAGSLMAAALVLAAGGASPAEEIAFLGQTGSYWQVWLVQPDGSGARQLTNSDYEKTRVAWFPDGTRLLVVSVEGRLFEVDIEAGREKALSMNLESIHDVAISPDGTWLAISASTGGERDNHDIWISRADGSDQRRLISMPWLQHEPRWSADGQWIYFVSGDGQQDHDLWRVRVSDGSKEQLTVGTRYHFEPDVAADGSVAFSSNQSGDYELYSRGPDGAALVRWTESPGMDGHPSWSPDGSALVFHSTRSGALELWRQAGPKATPTQLTQITGGARDPEWRKGAR